MTLALLGARNPDGGWGYRPGGESVTETTALAALALIPFADAEVLTSAAAWLAARQRSDGLMTAGLSHADASWTTPLAAIALHRLGTDAAAARAADALLATTVRTFTPLLTAGLYGYDTSLEGWPWTPGDFSFVEPTALAVLFLKQRGYALAPRVRSGVRLLRDRSLPSGGWNYGEPKVLGGTLYPTIAPTALALIALADEPDEITAAASAWLASQQGQISALFSLAWAAIAAMRTGPQPAWLDDLAARWSSAPPERRGPLETALALLALAEPAEHPLRIG